MNTPKPSTLYRVGDWVQPIVPKTKQSDRTAYARIAAVENYTDAHGTYQFIYVKWYGSDGKPESDLKRINVDDIEQMEEP